MAKIIDPDLLADSAADDASTEVYINITTKTIKLVKVGNLSDSGVTIKTIYSFLKEEWKNDPNIKNLAGFDFPMVPITDEFFEFVSGWTLYDATSIQLIRDGGFLVRDSSGNVIQHWSGVRTIGTVEANDQVYYNQGLSASNFIYEGPVNEVIQIIDDPNGDGNYVDGFDYSNSFQIFLREQGQLYSQSSLLSVGATDLLAPKVFAFALNTGTDLKISETDGNIGTISPYTDINIKYFTTPFSKAIDSATKRNFGIVIEVGTHTGVDGLISVAGGATLSTSEGSIVGSDYTGGTLVIHDGVNEGIYNISGTPTATEVAITTTFSGTASNSSFTLERATPVVATAEEIYEKVQYQLRQSVDIDSTGNSIIGNITDELLKFVGDTLICGIAVPTNDNGGGSGVIIEGFSAADTNRIQFYDNLTLSRTYPFVAVLTLNFGANLVSDADAKYWVYFTTLTGANNDFNEVNAVLVEDNDGISMSGTIGGQTSIQKTFNYDGNVQAGRTAATNADITAVAIGLVSGQYVKATATITRSTTNNISLVAALERNYSNPL